MLIERYERPEEVDMHIGDWMAAGIVDCAFNCGGVCRPASERNEEQYEKDRERALQPRAYNRGCRDYSKAPH